MITIYKLRLKEDPEGPFYIGSTKDIIKREKAHYHDYKNKYGTIPLLHSYLDNFQEFTLIIENLDICDNKERYMREAFYIKKYKSKLNKLLPHVPKNEKYANAKQKNQLFYDTHPEIYKNSLQKNYEYKTKILFQELPFS